MIKLLYNDCFFCYCFMQSRKDYNIITSTGTVNKLIDYDDDDDDGDSGD